MALSSRTGRGPSAVMQRSQVVEVGPRITRASKRFDCASRPPEPRHPNPDTHSCNRRPQMHTMCLISAPCPTRAHARASSQPRRAFDFASFFQNAQKRARVQPRPRARALGPRGAPTGQPSLLATASLPPVAARGAPERLVERHSVELLHDGGELHCHDAQRAGDRGGGARCCPLGHTPPSSGPGRAAGLRAAGAGAAQSDDTAYKRTVST